MHVYKYAGMTLLNCHYYVLEHWGIIEHIQITFINKPPEYGFVSDIEYR